jgi:5-methylcytosine-specific restriction protein A
MAGMAQVAQRSVEATEYRRLYKLAIWHKRLRPQKLAQDPLCERCQRLGKVTAATVVNHKQPHRGDYSLFTDRDNLESVCKPCHDRHAQADEIRGYSKDVGADGWPIDGRHPANRA